MWLSWLGAAQSERLRVDSWSERMPRLQTRHLVREWRREDRSMFLSFSLPPFPTLGKNKTKHRNSHLLYVYPDAQYGDNLTNLRLNTL